MTDIVERLHKKTISTSPGYLIPDLMAAEAANEIERLQKKVAEWKQAAGVEADLRREFLARAEKAEAELDILNESLIPRS